MLSLPLPNLVQTVNKHLRSRQVFFLTALILIMGTAARFHHLSELFHWTLDEEYWAYIPHNIATLYHFPLIGGPISGTGLYTGPLFVWLMAPVFWLVNSHPLGIAVFVSTLGVITIVLLLRLLPSLTNLPTALYAGLIYASSTLITIYDRKYWNVTPIPILSLITLYLIHSLRFSVTPIRLFILSLTLSLAFHSHMTGSVLILFTLIAWFVYRLPRFRLLHLAFWFGIWQLPLIIFEFRHHFINLSALLKLFTSTTHPSSPILTRLTTALLDSVWLTLHTFSRLIYAPMTDIASELTLCAAYAPLKTPSTLPILIFSAIILIYALLKLRYQNIFSLMILSNFLLLIVHRFTAPPGSWYPGLLGEYYLIPSFIAFITLTASLLYHLYLKSPSVALSLIIMLIVINLHLTFSLSHSHGFATKQSLVNQSLSQLQQAPYSLNVTGDECQIYGFRYLFTLSGHEPTLSYLDQHFSWLYQRRLPTTPPQYHLTIDVDSATINLKPHEQDQAPALDSNPQR